MYKVAIQDNLQQAAIGRRQKLDEDRKQRIFDTKTRIDVRALEEQIRIKNEAKVAETQRDLAFDASRKSTNDMLIMMDEHVKRARREHLTSINDFRKHHQQADQRRDYDLYDPQALRNGAPARAGDADGRCGVSGLQKFEGEDLASRRRGELQKQQIRVWTKEQMREKQMMRDREAAEKRNFEEYEANVAQKAAALQSEVARARAEQARHDNEINQQLAAIKKHNEAAAKARELDMNTREISNQIFGSFLTETPDVFNIHGGHKVRVDLFKGITQQQSAEILRTQALQRQEAEAKREAEQMEENKWALQQAANHRASLLLDRERQRQAMEQSVRIREENKRKSMSDKERINYIEKVVYTNPPTEQYFAQFSTTSR
ncbi:Protein Tax-1 [Irineochytrium annulatum]|nr:Protein Tax-1 [Irineochytrium annulatum]